MCESFQIPILQLEPWRRTKLCFSVSQCINNMNLAHCYCTFRALLPRAFTVVSEFTNVSMNSEFKVIFLGKSDLSFMSTFYDVRKRTFKQL